MWRIGLTGGIASGKSTVVSILRALGAPVVDADRIVHEVQEPGGEAYGAIVRAFGPGIVGPDGRLDRAALGRRVFGDAAERRRLEAIVHPIVRCRMDQALRLLAETGARVVVLDIPLLFEAGQTDRVDEIWVVYVDPETQLRRLMARDGIDEVAARQRVAAQLPLDEKRRQAHVVIDNRGSLEETRAQVVGAWQRALERARAGDPE